MYVAIRFDGAAELHCGAAAGGAAAGAETASGVAGGAGTRTRGNCAWAQFTAARNRIHVDVIRTVCDIVM
jgi:hypothetical protein